MNNENQKYVYIALIYIPSAVGTFTKLTTGYGYSHATFSFDENLESCHAFSRLQKDTTFIGGYINENKSHYIYDTNKNVKIDTIIYKIPVTQQENEDIKKYIEEISNDNEYLYNLYSMCTLVALRGFRTYKAMHCTEFIAQIMTRISSIKMSKKWYKYLPKDINRDLQQYTFYKGILDTKNVKRADNDFFFKEIDKREYRKKRRYIFKELLYRLIFKKCSPNYDYRKAKFEDNIS